MINTLKNKIMNNWSTLTYAEREFLDYILNNDISAYSISQLSEKTGISKSSVTKISKKIGYEGFKDLMWEYKNTKQIDTTNLDENLLSEMYTAHKLILDKYMTDPVNNEDIKMLATLIKERESFAYGIGSNHYLLGEVSYRFTTIGKIFTVSEQHGILSNLMTTNNKKNVFIINSVRGGKSMFLDVIDNVKKYSKDTIIVFITSAEDSFAFNNENIDHVIKLPTFKNIYGFLNSGGQTYSHLFWDMLFVYFEQMSLEENLQKWEITRKQEK